MRAAGSEFVLACDMRFAARESAIFAQFEPAFGLLPGGGAAQHLTRLMGRARALEVMLSADDYDADSRSATAGSTERSLPPNWTSSSKGSRSASPSSRRGPRGSQGPRQRRHLASGRRLPARLGPVRRGRPRRGGSGAHPRRDGARAPDPGRGDRPCFRPRLNSIGARVCLWGSWSVRSSISLSMAGRSRPSLVTDAASARAA